MKFYNFTALIVKIFLFKTLIYGGNAEQSLHFSVTHHNKCLETNTLNIIRNFARISVPECISECKNRLSCKAINYRRRTNICELISSDNNKQIINNGRTGPCVLVLKSDINEEQTCGCATGEVCENYKCVTKECLLTNQAENAEIDGNINKIGAEISYTCDSGYTNLGQGGAECLPFGIWSKQPSCVITCGTPSSVTGATRSFTTTILNSVVTYSCQTGYTHTSGDLQRVCGSDGKWEGVLPTCTVDCGTPYIVTGATRSFATTVLNSVVTYACQTGYAHTSGDLQRVCGSDGNWGGILPTCTIDCGTPYSVTGGTRSYSSTTLNSVVIYVCQTGFTHTSGDVQRICGSDGNWGGILPTCVVDCPQLPNVPNSNVSPGGLTQGTQHTFTCTSGNYFATGVTSVVTTCLSGGVWSNMNVICPRDSVVENCPGCGILRDCEDVQSLGLKTTGTYLIFPTGNTGFYVRCDMDTTSGGWTIIQRRISSSDFYKTWTEYKDGFGDEETNYWLGNDNIATLTSNGNYKIRFDLYNQNNDHKYAEYSKFKITDESLKYKLTVSGFSGNAGDSFSIHNSKKFTTKDSDNDPAADTNCAVMYTGAWWYASCHDSNLNGMYGSSQSGKGLIWYTFTGLTDSLSKTEMKIKRK